MAGVFILMLSSATLEAQRNENDKFFDFMTSIGKHFGGKFNDAEKTIELDLNSANSFLEGLHRFTTHKIVAKNENGEFECKKSKNHYFKMAIKTILGEKSDEMPSGSADSVKFSDAQLFNLLFSFAARLEALVHGKNSDGTLKEKQENPKDKIQTFLAVPKCFILPESELSIFDYWIEIIKMKTIRSQEPIFGVAIYKEKYDKYRWEGSNQKAFALSRENYEILKQLNDQKFSIYESLNLLRKAFTWGYIPRIIPSGEIPQIFDDLLEQIYSVFYFNWKRNKHWDKNYKCEYAMFFQNVSENLMKMMSDKGIDPELRLDSKDKEIREEVQKDVEKSCKKFENEEVKIIFLNNVHYELAINFKFNQREDVYDRV